MTTTTISPVYSEVAYLDHPTAEGIRFPFVMARVSEVVDQNEDCPICAEIDAPVRMNVSSIDIADQHQFITCCYRCAPQAIQDHSSVHNVAIVEYSG